MNLSELPDVTTWAIPAFLLLVMIEWATTHVHAKPGTKGYSGADAATSLAMGLGSVFWDLLWRIPSLAVYATLYAATPIHWTFQWWLFPVILVAQDFCYYWSHRLHHTVRLLWAAHVVHHSSTHFNLTTALRQSWTSGLTTWIFYVPLIALGVSPELLFFTQGVNLIYQFWIHTERIGKLPSVIEFFFNTPSHHRVHHGSNGSYLDRNFAGILILWDRWFDSFAPEREKVVYGLTKNINTFNPIHVAYHEYRAIAGDVSKARSSRDIAGYLFRSPGWAYETRDSGDELLQ